jgi:ankyrin repeat protein
LLLAAGAKKDLKDTNGQTARDWATNRGDDLGKQAADLLK